MSVEEVSTSEAAAGAIEGPSGFVQWAFLQNRLTGDLLWVYLDAPAELSVYVSKGGAPGVWKKLSSVLRYSISNTYFVQSFSIQHGTVHKSGNQVTVLGNLGGGFQSLTVSADSPPSLFIGDGGNSRKAVATLEEIAGGFGGAESLVDGAPLPGPVAAVPAVPTLAETPPEPKKDSPGMSMALIGLSGLAALLIFASMAQKD